jgi:hypothetical protein
VRLHALLDPRQDTAHDGGGRRREPFQKSFGGLQRVGKNCLGAVLRRGGKGGLLGPLVTVNRPDASYWLTPDGRFCIHHEVQDGVVQ